MFHTELSNHEIIEVFDKDPSVSIKDFVKTHDQEDELRAVLTEAFYQEEEPCKCMRLY